MSAGRVPSDVRPGAVHRHELRIQEVFEVLREGGYPKGPDLEGEAEACVPPTERCFILRSWQRDYDDIVVRLGLDIRTKKRFLKRRMFNRRAHEAVKKSLYIAQALVYNLLILISWRASWVFKQKFK